MAPSAHTWQKTLTLFIDMNKRQNLLMTATDYEVKDWVENTECVPTAPAAVAPTTWNFFPSCKKNILEIVEVSAGQMSSARELFLEYASLRIKGRSRSREVTSSRRTALTK
jgi:hypothetical protein